MATDIDLLSLPNVRDCLVVGDIDEVLVMPTWRVFVWEYVLQSSTDAPGVPGESTHIYSRDPLWTLHRWLFFWLLQVRMDVRVLVASWATQAILPDGDDGNVNSLLFMMKSNPSNGFSKASM